MITSKSFLVPLLGIALAPALALAQTPAAPAAPDAPPPMGATTTTTTSSTSSSIIPLGRASADDLTGALGFGVGVTAGTSLIVPGNTVAIKYWISNAMALVPSLTFNFTKPSGGGDSTWTFNPQAVLLFVPFKTHATRFEVGAGLGIGLNNPGGGADTGVHIFVPITAGLEHFFTEWFSMGIAVQSNLIDYTKNVAFASTIDTTAFVGSLFFYTD